jgi:hypothetical protein
MSDNVEITVNNPLNILDQNIEELSSNELSTSEFSESSESSGELSYDSDDETSESYISFLEEANDESSCYVCYDKTIYVSPCQCKIAICNDCFIDVIINNGKNCTICKDRFEESIIKDVKDNFSEVSHSSEELTRSITINNRIRDRQLKFFMCFAIFIVIIFTSPIFGMIYKLVFNKYFYGNIYTIDNFLIGLIFWTNFIFLIIFLIYSYKLLNYLFREFLNLIYYYFIHN